MNKPPNFTNYWREYPHKVLKAFGQEGKSPTPITDSKFGHSTIGSGRIVLQDNELINRAIADKSFYRNRSLNAGFDYAKKNHQSVHLIGLLSDVGVKANINHLLALIELAYRKSFKDLFLDIISDGLNSPVGKLPEFITKINDKFRETGLGKISSISGRDYAMTNVPRKIMEVFQMLVNGEAEMIDSTEETVKRAYRNGLSDYQIKPTLIKDENGINTLKNGDVIIFFNFRPEKIKLLTRVLIDPNFQKKLGLKKTIADLYVVTFTKYFKTLNTQIAFERAQLSQTLPEMLARYQKRNLRIAEKIKEMQVTYFFNGGRAEPFAYEERHIFESKKPEDFGRYPAMSGDIITKDAIAAIKSRHYDFILINFANADTIAHSGNIGLTGRAVLATDKFLGQIVDTNLRDNGITLISADHGIVEQIKGTKTVHTTNPVPFIMISKEKKRDLIKGALANPFSMLSKLISPVANLTDIAPTILELLNIPKPPLMTGHSLLNNLE